MSSLNLCVEEYAFKHDKEFLIRELSTPQSLLTENVFDIIFLDIGFNGKHEGMKFAHQFRKRGNKSIIVFLTALQQYSLDGYEAEAFRFLLKPVTQEQIFKTMDAIYFKWENESHSIAIRAVDGNVYLLCDKVISIESGSRKRQIFYGSQIIDTWEPLKDLFARLPISSFAYASKSDIVNLRHVVTVATNDITLSDRRTVILARRQKNAFLSALDQFLDTVHGE